MPDIKTVGIISKPGVPAAAELVPKLFTWLRERGITVRYDDETAEYAGTDGAISRMEIPEGADLVIVLGGDGTLLSAAVSASANCCIANWSAKENEWANTKRSTTW